MFLPDCAGLQLGLQFGVEGVEVLLDDTGGHRVIGGRDGHRVTSLRILLLRST